MPSYTLKNIPDDLYQQAESAAKRNFRSLNQELLYRVQLSFELEEAAVSSLHAQWIKEALESGPATPASPAHWKNALRRGLARAKARK